MLYQELPRIESTRLDGWAQWLAPAVIAAAALTAGLLLLLLGQPLRDGAGCVAGISTAAGISPVEVERVGSHGDLLLWRFPDPSPPDPLTSALKRMQGIGGARLASAGVMAAVVDAKGNLLGGNQPFI